MVKIARRLLVVGLLVATACGTTFCHMRHDSSEFVVPIFVSIGKNEYGENEPIAITLILTNPFLHQITIPRSSFGLAEYQGEEGFYIDDDQLRSKCHSHFLSNNDFLFGLNQLTLRPGEIARERIKIPIEAAFQPGKCTIPYELRISFYDNETYWQVAPGDILVIYDDPLDRPIIERWRDAWHDFTNGHDAFTLRGKLEFLVK